MGLDRSAARYQPSLSGSGSANTVGIFTLEEAEFAGADPQLLGKDVLDKLSVVDEITQKFAIFLASPTFYNLKLATEELEAWRTGTSKLSLCIQDALDEVFEERVDNLFAQYTIARKTPPKTSTKK